MNNPFKSISLSYKIAPLEVREQFSMNAGTCRRLLQFAKASGSIEEMLVLSTCNRFEVYFISQQVRCEQLIKLLKVFIPEVKHDDELKNYFKLFNRPEPSVEHLFRVSMGLESQVLGDSQIISQVKEAYQNSVDADMAGPFVHRLLHTIFHTHKRVTQESCFADCHASVPQAAKKLVQRLLPDNNATILILGMGKVGKDLCRKLSRLGYDVIVSNRTEEKSEAVAEALGLKSISLSQVSLVLDKVHLVASALAVDQPFLTEESCHSMVSGTTKYLIDLSVPRSISPELAAAPNIALFNMDDVNEEICSTLQKRKNAIPQVETIIDSELSGFLEWVKEMHVWPAIHQMKQALESIRKEEIARCLKHIDFEESHMINVITKNIVDRVIKLPALKLKLACRRGDEANMINILNEIFSI